MVRRFAGYQRLDTEKQLETLNKLYELLSEVRDGARVTRKYDKAQTAYQRVLKRKDIAVKTKQRLRERYKKLNPKKLLLEITNLGKKRGLFFNHRHIRG